MSLVIKRRDLTDPAQLQALILEHADDLERGLTILDSRLLLGQVAIDVVAVDADGALVLIAIGLVADEALILKVVDAYSWCFEYPEAIHRLYPTVEFSAARPPRVMFVVERMPEAFHRKIKQLGFPEVDCIEFRHLDIDGTPAVYFDGLARLRRGPVGPIATPEPTRPGPVTQGRPTSVRLQKLLGAERSAASREPAPVVRMVHRTAPPPQSKPVPTPAPAAAPPITPPSAAVPSPSAEDPRINATPASAIETPAAVTLATSDHEATAATVDALIEAVAGVADFAEVLVEPFVSAEPPAVNGHVHLREAAAIDIPVTPEPAPPQSPVIEHALVVVDASEPAVVATAIAITEPEPITRLALPEPAPDPLVIELPDAEPAEMTTGAPLELVATPCIDEPDPVASALAAPEPETTAPAPSTPIVEPHVPPALELEVLSLEPDSKPLAAVPSDPVTVPAAALAPTPALETDPIAAAMTELEPVTAVAPALALEPDPVAAAMAEEAPAVTPADAEPPAPVVIVTPSVFSRRAPAQTAPNGDQRVSFAGVSKELLPHATRTSQIEPAPSIQRPSVEEITRATINDLVGAASEKTAAFASPAGAFLKRPRTIAPPPSDGQPIGAGPKLARAARREESSSPAVASAAAGDTAAAPVVPPQQGFEGVQFPNDGVLTRQWMEFLNQMAGDK